MKLNELAANLAANLAETLNKPLQDGQSATVEPLLTNKAAAAHKRRLVPGTIALRVEIVANEDIGEMGRMVLFVPVSKAQLKRDPDMVLGSVLRFVGTAVTYRSDILGKVRERVEA